MIQFLKMMDNIRGLRMILNYSSRCYCSLFWWFYVNLSQQWLDLFGRKTGQNGGYWCWFECSLWFVICQIWRVWSVEFGYSNLDYNNAMDLDWIHVMVQTFVDVSDFLFFVYFLVDFGCFSRFFVVFHLFDLMKSQKNWNIRWIWSY